tara:strand:+ start:1059 stop:1544 length:486 start_codon:yes stop_codon:yes gene_type:complete
VIYRYDPNGRQAAQLLLNYGHSFVVIEQDLALMQDRESIHYYQRTRPQDKVLEQDQIDRVKHLITALTDDICNLFVVLSAREMNPDSLIESCLISAGKRSKLRRAGADHVIMLDQIGGNHVAGLLMVPDLIRFVEELSWLDGDSPNLEEIAIELLKKFQNK